MFEQAGSKIALGIEYNGTAYAGWQFQAGLPSVQGVLEAGLAVIADQPLTVHCAGRTDAGVHAFEQVVHFEAPVARPLQAWVRGCNTHLPSDVRVLWAKTVSETFHARYSAIARCYRYCILNRAVASALHTGRLSWVHQPLDAQRMHHAAQALLGEHDFSSFRAHSCQSHSPNRLMHFIDIYRQQDQVIIDICANAFLHHMVRNIVGALIEVGSGKQTPSWIGELLMLKDRTRAAMTAPADGLHLLAVYYPRHYGLAQHPVFERLPANVARFEP